MLIFEIFYFLINICRHYLAVEEFSMKQSCPNVFEANMFGREVLLGIATT